MNDVTYAASPIEDEESKKESLYILFHDQEPVGYKKIKYREGTEDIDNVTYGYFGVEYEPSDEIMSVGKNKLLLLVVKTKDEIVRSGLKSLLKEML